jgi:uncharacterized protein YndB with AHSA1/START domain
MAVNEIDIAVPPERVWDVLADARSFGYWVVGSSTIRAADPEWPARGAVFEHSQALPPPFGLEDRTAVLESEPPRLLRLRVQARPVTVAHTTLRLAPTAQGTHVTLEEVAADTLSSLVMNPLTDPLLRLRNGASLRRLKRLAEGEAPMPDGPLPPRTTGDAAR